MPAILMSVATGVSQEPQRAGTDFFEQRIRPLLAANCYECHGSEKQENELRLDRFAKLRKGGASGKAISPGNPDASLLIAAVRYVDDDLKMPPKRKLTDAQIADLVRWVEMGAPHPDGDWAGEVPAPAKPVDGSSPEGGGHWAFQPPAKPPLPEVKNPSWPQTPIDHFVLAKLEAAGLSPAPPADRRTLIRRATFDLIGLPPTPAEVAAFVDDDSPQAFAKVVDRLLASPRYGERWGRHWLDVARYADSNGLDENVAHGNAWRYRDWVIRAFNDDKPYDEFVREQLAGDLLSTENPSQRSGNLIATGFLSLGPKVLAEVDERKMELDIIDEQIDAVGRSLLGLTLGCARCHDHKFDPITARDYYALAGIFKSTHTMDSFTKIARWHESPLHSDEYERAKAAHDGQLAAKNESLRDAIAAATTKLQQELGEGAALPQNPEESFPPVTRETLKQLRDDIAAMEKNAPTPPTAMGVQDGEPTDTAVHFRGTPVTLGDPVPRGFPQFLLPDRQARIDPQQSGRLELANWLTSPDHPLTSRVMVNRIWRWHFGRGLVETTDNFGRKGAKPTHPELLDWLAIEIATPPSALSAKGGIGAWSIKRLHRQIMLSATYQTGGEPLEKNLAADPENRLLWRTNIRRLEAEELRDGLLAVAGELDTTMGGPVLHVENRAFLFDHTSKDETSYSLRRRSVYLPVVRNHLHDAFMLFDYTDASVPTGNRNTSTVTSQALYLMNSEFLADVSQQLAEKLLSLPIDDDQQRIAKLYDLAYGRPAREEEVRRAESYLRRFQQPSPDADTAAADGTSRALAWRLLCQATLMSNEFIYVR